MLFRHEGGERVWSVVRVPTEEEEQARQLHRELQNLGQESTRHINRIKGLLASIGLALEVDKHFLRTLQEARQWNGKPVPEELRDRLLRDFERLQVINRQIRALNQQRNKTLRTQDSPTLRKVQQLLGLRGIGVNSAWLYVHEFFGWRKFKNRREVGSLAGLAPTPYSSGDLRHEQGISKAGNRRMRWRVEACFRRRLRPMANTAASSQAGRLWLRYGSEFTAAGPAGPCRGCPGASCGDSWKGG